MLKARRQEELDSLVAEIESGGEKATAINMDEGFTAYRSIQDMPRF